MEMPHVTVKEHLVFIVLLSNLVSCCILDEAENILSNEANLIALPGGPLTFDDVELARKALKK